MATLTDFVLELNDVYDGVGTYRTAWIDATYISAFVAEVQGGTNAAPVVELSFDGSTYLTGSGITITPGTVFTDLPTRFFRIYLNAGNAHAGANFWLAVRKAD